MFYCSLSWCRKEIEVYPWIAYFSSKQNNKNNYAPLLVRIHMHHKMKVCIVMYSNIQSFFFYPSINASCATFLFFMFLDNFSIIPISSLFFTIFSLFFSCFWGNLDIIFWLIM